MLLSAVRGTSSFFHALLIAVPNAMMLIACSLGLYATNRIFDLPPVCYAFPDDMPGQSFLWLISYAALPAILFVSTVVAIRFLKRNSSLYKRVVYVINIYIFVIFACAMLYSIFGLSGPSTPYDYGLFSSPDGSTSPSIWDDLYFSVITFTTVGYGDFQPCPASRIIAASEAIFGLCSAPFLSAIILEYLLRKER